MDENKRPIERTIKVLLVHENSDDKKKSFWKTEFWKSGVWATILTTIISGTILWLQYAKEENRLASQSAIERDRQAHEVRLKYLDVVLKETNDVNEKESILRFLSMNSSDSVLAKWAGLELFAVLDLKRTREARDSLTLAFAAMSDSMKTMKSIVATENGEKAKLVASLAKLKNQIDSINFEVYRKSKSAMIKQTVKPFGFEDIQFEDIKPWPSCNIESIKSVSGNIDQNKACLDSYGNQATSDLKFEKNKWIWVTKYESIRFDKEFDKPFNFSKSVQKTANCICEYEELKKDIR